MTQKNKDKNVKKTQNVDKNTQEQSSEVLKIEQLEKELKESKENALKAFADFENYKKRVQKEREEMNLIANASILNLLLEVLDDLKRGVAELKEVPTGLGLIEDKIKNILEESGIEAVKVEKGDEFNPKIMEAIGTLTVKDKGEDNKVIHVERTGYKLKEKDFIVRGCRVIVGKMG